MDHAAALDLRHRLRKKQRLDCQLEEVEEQLKRKKGEIETRKTGALSEEERMAVLVAKLAEKRKVKELLGERTVILERELLQLNRGKGRMKTVGETEREYLAALGPYAGT